MITTCPYSQGNMLPEQGHFLFVPWHEFSEPLLLPSPSCPSTPPHTHTHARTRVCAHWRSTNPVCSPARTTCCYSTAMQGKEKAHISPQQATVILVTTLKTHAKQLSWQRSSSFQCTVINKFSPKMHKLLSLFFNKYLLPVTIFVVMINGFPLSQQLWLLKIISIQSILYLNTEILKSSLNIGVYSSKLFSARDIFRDTARLKNSQAYLYS